MEHTKLFKHVQATIWSVAKRAQNPSVFIGFPFCSTFGQNKYFLALIYRMMTHIFWQTGKLSTNWEESRCNLDAFHNPHACRVISVLTRSNLHLDLGIKPFPLPPRHILILEFHLHVLERWNCWNPVKIRKSIGAPVLAKRDMATSRAIQNLKSRTRNLQVRSLPAQRDLGDQLSTAEICDLRGST